MNCCIDCFSDCQIRQIIDSLNQQGRCDFCGKQNTKIYPISGSGNVEALLGNIVDSYSIAATGGKMLHTALFEDWNIFNVSPDIIQQLVQALCLVQFNRSPELFGAPIIIPECLDNDYLSEFSITHGYSWREFSETIKYHNRFFSSIFNPDALASYLSYLAKTYPTDTIMYRARICKDKRGFLSSEMGAPPREKRAAGRVNPEGVGVLYLSSQAETALYEARSSIYDFVTIGTFRSLREIRVVNLAGISLISPFVYNTTNDLQQYAVNQQCLREISEDISKPLRRNDSPLEYLPTQFICEFIKNQGYDGVEYSSTMTKNGYNLAIFDESLFKCREAYVLEIAGLEYTARKIP